MDDKPKDHRERSRAQKLIAGARAVAQKRKAGRNPASADSVSRLKDKWGAK